MSSYKNPIPIMLSEGDLSFFFQPITDILNRLDAEGILLPSTKYYKLVVKFDDYKKCKQEFIKLGLDISKAKAILVKGIITINTKELFNEYASDMRKTFTMTHVQGVEPAYLEHIGQMDFCTNNCSFKTCINCTPKYCTQLFVHAHQNPRKD